MKLIFTPPDIKLNQRFMLGPEEEKHLIRVLRMKEGDLVEGSDGTRRMKLKLARVDKRYVAEVVEEEALHDDRRLALAVARIDAPRLGIIVSSASQFRVTDIYFVACERSDRESVPVGRLERIALESAKQTGSYFLPRLHLVESVPALCPAVRAAHTLLLDPDAKESILDGLDRVGPSGPVLVLIGPTGDFTPDEKKLLREAGAAGCLLSREVIRSETAATVALGVAAVSLHRTSSAK